MRALLAAVAISIAFTVDNGKIVTSAGLTSGMDGALHVVEKLYSRDRAREVALHLEYDWRPDSKYARASLADRHLPDLDFGSGTRFRQTRSIGDADSWRVEGTVSTAQHASELLERVATQLREGAHWEPAGGGSWSFSDEAGQRWRASLEVSDGETEGSLAVALGLERAR